MNAFPNERARAYDRHGGLVDRPAPAKRMRMRPQQRIMVARTVGYPKASG